MNLSTRRIFLLQLAAGSGSALAMTPVPKAGPAAAVDENDALAKSIGYVADASRSDKKKFPRYASGQKCGNCALFQGKGADALGPCPIFAGKQVAAAGWCSSYARKA